MQQESQFLRSLFDEAPLPYMSLDSEGRLLTINRAWQEELLYEKHEVLGRWFGDFVCSDQKPQFRERFRQFVEEGQAQGIVWSLLRKDGSTVQVSFSGRVLRDDAERFQRSYCMFFDITKRSEGEASLRESEELRLAFMDEAQAGFSLFDESLRLIYANEMLARLLRKPLSELVGKTMVEITPNVEQSGLLEQYRRVLETGDPLRLDDYKPSDGEADRRTSIRAFRVGSKLGVILRDVTESKLSERRLLESEARWRMLAEGSPDHILLLDQNLKIEYANTASPGLELDDLLGQYICRFAIESQKAFVRETLEGVLATGEPATYETDYITPDKQILTYESRAARRSVDGVVAGLIVSSRDISRRKADENRIAALLKRQTAMAELSIAFGNARAMDDIFRLAYQHISDLMDADVFIITRYEAAEALIHTEYACVNGMEQRVKTLLPVPLDAEGRGMQSEVIRSGTPALLSDYREAFSATGTMYATTPDGENLMKLDQDEVIAELPRSALLVPMKIRGEVIGVMQVQSNTLNAFQEEDSRLLSGLASITAVAVENRSLIAKSQATYEGTIRALATAIELRDPYTSQHQEGVARIAAKIALELGLTADQIRAVELSAHVHDIGKVVIPAEILSKPTSLSGAQMSIVQAHVEAAEDVLAGVAFPWPIAEIVCQHHERLDGSGYPRGIQDDQIRLEARILAVADVADAMMSHRPYRPAHSTEETMSELRQQRGQTLDTAVVDACLAVLEREYLVEETVS